MIRCGATSFAVLAVVTTTVLAACTGGSGSAPPVSPAVSTPAPSSSSPTSASSPSPTVTTSAAPHVATDRLPVVPLAGAGPKVRFPAAPAAVGSGAHPTIGAVPDSLWNRMVGYSWTPGCPVGRSSLRLVEVNYWGFDGVRHRGRLVVASSIAGRTVSAFTALYGQHFRIRQMRPMDSTWGHDPKGPGADDYAAMAADDTSAFNCRYVGGEEARKVWSNHAYGRAIDVNDFENPYVDASGTVYPSAYFLHRRTGAGTFTSSTSPAVRAFTGLGFSWGGRWSAPDLQHMEIG